MLRYEEQKTRRFEDLSRLFFLSFFFSLAANSLTTILTLAYVVVGWGSELNPVMTVELRAFGIWVIPLHVIAIIAYYALFYFTMKHTVMTKGRYRLWCLVLILIPILSSFDLAFDARSAL